MSRLRLPVEEVGEGRDKHRLYKAMVQSETRGKLELNGGLISLPTLKGELDNPKFGKLILSVVSPTLAGRRTPYKSEVWKT